MSAESTGLPLFDAARAALDAAIDEAESVLAMAETEDKAHALELCVQVAEAFDRAERSSPAMRRRANARGRKLFREMARKHSRKDAE